MILPAESGRQPDSAESNAVSKIAPELLVSSDGHINSPAAADPVETPRADALVEAQVLSKGLVDRIKEDVTTLGHEVTEPGHRMRRLTAVTVAAATQVMDRGRAMIFAIPYAFDHSLTYGAEHGLNGYQTAGLAGAAVGTTFGAWTSLVGFSFHKALNNLPETTSKVTENHPAMIDVISGAVGGIVDDDALSQQPVPRGEYEVGPYDARKSKFGKATLALSRAFNTTFVFGSTAYVGVAKTKGYSDESNKKLRHTATAESVALTGGLAVTVSALVTHNAFGLAQDIRDAVTNKPAMLGLSALLIGKATLENIRSRRKAEKKIIAEASIEATATEVVQALATEDIDLVTKARKIAVMKKAIES